MRRLTIDPRPNWQKRVEEYGLYYHTLRGEPYWDESACYQFTAYRSRHHRTGHPDPARHVPRTRAGGDRQAHVRPLPHSHGVRGVRHPVVGGSTSLRSTAGSTSPSTASARRRCSSTTPTRRRRCVEASVAQWVWLKDVDERGDQFNSIHERLIEAWKAVRERDGGPIHFAAMSDVDSPEDYITAEYMRDTAIQAGFKTSFLDIDRHRLGPHPQRVRRSAPASRSTGASSSIRGNGCSTRSSGRTSAGRDASGSSRRGRSILSCKSILPLLYERHPDSPFLLPASFDPLPDGQLCPQADPRPRGREHPGRDRWQTRPRHRRAVRGRAVCLPGARAASNPHEGRYPVLGSWVVNGVACGLGIREDDSLVDA